MARSMNGINNIEVNNIEFPDGSTISSASNLVQLDTNNNFTGNNTYNTNLPTSDVNPDLVDINNNTMLNRFSADKLYSTDTNDYITGFSRNGTTGVITLTQEDTGTPITTETYTSITDAQLTAIDNAVLKTTAQEIDGIKTFVDFPEIKKVGLVVPNPIDDEQFATKKYVDDNAGGGSGDAVLSAGSSGSEQTFTGFNKFINVINAPAVPTNANHLTNKTYVDTPRDKSVVNRQITYYRDVVVYNHPFTGYSLVPELDVDYTPLYTGSHFLITLNTYMGIPATNDRQTYIGIRLLRNNLHLSAASGIGTGSTSANGKCWLANNTPPPQYTNGWTNLNIIQQHGHFLDTDPPAYTLGGLPIKYGIGIRTSVWNSSSSYPNQFTINRMYGPDTRFQRPSSFLMVEEIYNAP